MTRDKLLWLFRWIVYFGTFLYGLGFILAAHTSWEIKSSLFSSMHGIDHSIPEIWGVFAIVACVTALMPKRWTKGAGNNLGHTLGVIVWLFALIIYVQTGYWLVALTVAIPYLALWVVSYFVSELP